MDEVVAHQLLGGRYRLIDPLGSGGMAVVWRGFDENLRRHVAIKLVAPQLARQPHIIGRLRTEALAAARLSHATVTDVYDYGEEPRPDGTTLAYLVMELVEGETLAAALHRAGGTLPWRQAVAVCTAIADGLAAAHAHDIVHRDITPGNIMLTRGGVKILDFGISVLADEPLDEPDDEILGTADYVSPERIRGRDASPAADVYALGLLLYRTLSGTLPWPSAGTTGVLLDHLHHPPAELPPVPGLPEPVAELCLRCLAKDPAARPEAAMVAAALAEAAGMTATTEAPRAVRAAAVAIAETSTAAMTQPSGSLPVWGAGLVAGFLALVVGTALIWAGGEPDAPSAADAADCAVTYAVHRDSGERFDATMTVRSSRSYPASAWRLAFVAPGDQQLTGSRRVTVRQRDREVVVAAGTAIGASPVPLSLHGRYATANPPPDRFTLDGQPCRAVVSAARPAVRGSVTEAGDSPAGHGGGKTAGKSAGKAKSRGKGRGGRD